MISFKSFSKSKNNPLRKSSNSPNNISNECNLKLNAIHNNGNISNKNTPKKDENVFQSFLIDQNDKYNFNININFDNKNIHKLNNNKNNYNSNKNFNVIYEDAEYENHEPYYSNKNIHQNIPNNNYSHPKKKKNFAAFSMYGNFKNKDKGFHLPLINLNKYGGYQKFKK